MYEPNSDLTNNLFWALKYNWVLPGGGEHDLLWELATKDIGFLR